MNHQDEPQQTATEAAQHGIEPVASHQTSDRHAR